MSNARDQEPGPSTQRWETVIGVSLVALVVALALFSWMQSTAQSNAYHDGLAAGERKEWDLAAIKFLEAGDHPNARPMLVEVNKKREERDRLYTTALKSSEERRWREARAALLEVQRIEPGYEDSASLLATAAANWERQTLAGIVYLVVDGPSPGLYLHDSAGARRKLPGSDAQSMVRAISADGMALVYDRPAHENLLASPLHQIELLEEGQLERMVVLARLGRDGSAGVLTTIPIPTLHPNGAGVFSSHGLWWYSPRGASPFNGYDLSYCKPYFLAPSNTVQVTTRGREGESRVVALDPPRARLLIAEGRGEARSPGRRNRLYLAGSAGEEPVLLHELWGDVYQAAFSRDGEWLLYIAQENGEQITRTVWVLPLEKGQRGVPHQLNTLSWSGLELNVGLTASFLPARGQAQVVVSRTDSKSEHVLIYALIAAFGTDGRVSLSREMARHSESLGPEGPFTRRWDAGAISHDGSYMVSLRRPKGEGAALALTDRHGDPLTWTHAPLPIRDSQMARIAFAPRDDYLVVTVRNPDGINRGSTEVMYVVPVSDGRLGKPRHAGAASIPYSREMPTQALPPQGSALVYVNAARELKAVYFDDMAEKPVAQHVKAVWSLQSASDLTWWR